MFGLFRKRSEGKPILIVGMSHINAIARALSDDDRRTIQVMNLVADKAAFDVPKDRLNLKAFAGLTPDFVFFSIKGNFHNAFGLIEHPTRMSIGDAARGRVPDDDARHFVPEDMVREHMKEQLETIAFRHLRRLAERFRSARLFHLGFPPPNGDAGHIAEHPGIFRAKLPLGVAPIGLRRKFYDIHADLYRDECRALGIEIVEVPACTVSEEGGLRPEYWSRDPTHGNGRYGALVLRQIRATAGVAQ